MKENSRMGVLRPLLSLTLSLAFQLALVATCLAQTAALVPNASQQYLNANGQPLAGGKVYSYVPGTTTPKTTWVDPYQQVPNTNPVTLNAGGYAPNGSGGNGGIFGQGNYRQIVEDANSNLIWDGFTSAYGSSSPSGSTGTDTAPIGTILPWAGFNFNVPTNWALAYGQALARTTYSQLEAAITIGTTTGNCTSSSTTVSGFSDTSQVTIGAPIEAACLPTGDTVASVVNSTTITVATPATATGTYTVTVFPWGNGDGVTTFNVPDLRGRVLPGADAMGGTAANRLTATYYGSSAATPGVAGGAQDRTISNTLVTANLPPYTPSGTITNGAITSTCGGNGCQGIFNNVSAATGGGFTTSLSSETGITSTQAASTFTGSAQGGASQPITSTFATIQPSTTMDYIIKVLPNTSGAGGVVSVNGLFGDVLLTAGSGLSVTTTSATSTVQFACLTGTTSVLGCLQPDGTTIIVSNGVISAVGSSQGITVGTTLVTGGPGVLYNSASGGTLTALAAVNSSVLSFSSGGTLQASTTLPSGLSATNLTLTTPTLGVASGSSLALGGATLGSNVLAATGAVDIGSTSSAALTVGPNGGTNPTLQVNASASSAATGLEVTSAAAGSGLGLSVISSGTNESLSLNAKGSGQLTLGGSSTGGVDLAAGGTGVTIHNALTATGLVTFADLASAAVATSSQYVAGTSSVVVPANVAFTSETTTTYGSTTTFDFSTFINTEVTLTGNITTMSVANVKAGQAGTIRFVQDATGGRTTAWNSLFKFPGGTTPSLSTGANDVDVLAYSCQTTTFCTASLLTNVH